MVCKCNSIHAASREERVRARVEEESSEWGMGAGPKYEVRGTKYEVRRKNAER
jgi:hypothetical protein